MDRVFIAIITSALLVLLGAAALLVTRTGILPPHQRTASHGISAERSLPITPHVMELAGLGRVDVLGAPVRRRDDGELPPPRGSWVSRASR